MLKSRKGSITVIALVMLLFLALLSGAWIIMLTQEKTNAYSDEKQQQAFYAAEAGYKRAALLLTNGYSTWSDVMTSDSNLKIASGYQNGKWVINFDGLKRANGANVTDANNNTDSTGGPWYAFSVVDSSGNDISGAVSAGTYTITSAGYYMGEMKIVKNKVTIKSSGGTGAGLAGLIQVGKTIDVANPTSVIGGNKTTSQFYATTVNDYTGAGFVNATKGLPGYNGYAHWASGQVYKGYFVTRLPLDTFFDLAKYTTDSKFEKDLSLSYSMEALKPDRIYTMDIRYSTLLYPTIDASKANGTTLVLYNSGTDSRYGILQVNTLEAPTSGLPLTIVSLLGSASNNQEIVGSIPSDGSWSSPTTTEKNAGISFRGNYTGRIRVISNGSIYLENNSNWGGGSYAVGNGTANAYMFLSNGWIMMQGLITAPAYVSSNYVGNATYDDDTKTGGDFSIYMLKTFYGEVITPGSVYLCTDVTYDNSVLEDKYFTLPAGMTIWNNY